VFVTESADMSAESSKKTADETDQNEDEHERRSKCGRYLCDVTP